MRATESASDCWADEGSGIEPSAHHHAVDRRVDAGLAQPSGDGGQLGLRCGLCASAWLSAVRLCSTSCIDTTPLGPARRGDRGSSAPGSVPPAPGSACSVPSAADPADRWAAPGPPADRAARDRRARPARPIDSQAACCRCRQAAAGADRSVPWLRSGHRDAAAFGRRPVGAVGSWGGRAAAAARR